ncbi:MAG: 3-deoxy-7-phosphoheptulonate synthase [Bacillota bacterium]
MIVKVKKKKDMAGIKDRISKLQKRVEFHDLDGKKVGILGDLSKKNLDIVRKDSTVEEVVTIKEPFKKTNRLFKETDTIVNIGSKQIGGDKFGVIAGPCAVESEEQLTEISESIKKSGANFLRGGAFKPRTSPYSFQGLREEGLKLLVKAREKTGLPIVTELMSADLLPLFLKYDVDVLQIGARNMQNFDLLKAVGKTKKPVLLKRGMSSTIKEFLMAAEYVMSQGNPNVILCERGIRTFEDFTRNTLDLSSVIAIKKLSHLPIIIDPSHATGKWWMVKDLAKAAAVVGADGLMVEVHNKPDEALSDGPQSLIPERFDSLMNDLRKMETIIGKEFQE